MRIPTCSKVKIVSFPIFLLQSFFLHIALCSCSYSVDITFHFAFLLEIIKFSINIFILLYNLHSCKVIAPYYSLKWIRYNR